MQSYPYRSVVGGVQYVATSCRPDVAFATGQLARYLGKHGPSHQKAAVQVLRYLKGSKHDGLQYRRGNVILTGYVDSDFAGCQDSRRSTTGFIIKLAGGAIEWSSRRQHHVTLSSCEAEQAAACDAAKEIVHLRALLKDIGFEQREPTVLYTDSQSSIALNKKQGSRGRSKHIDVRMFYVRELINNNIIDLQWMPGEDLPADLLTKALGTTKFVKLKSDVVTHVDCHSHRTASAQVSKLEEACCDELNCSLRIRAKSIFDTRLVRVYPQLSETAVNDRSGPQTRAHLGGVFKHT
jgi:hypothetical protein